MAEAKAKVNFAEGKKVKKEEVVEAVEAVAVEEIKEAPVVTVASLEKKIKTRDAKIKKMKEELTEQSKQMEEMNDVLGKAKALIEQRNEETAMLANNLQQATAMHKNLLEAVSNMVMAIDLGMKPYRETIQNHVNAVNQVNMQQQQQLQNQTRGE